MGEPGSGYRGTTGSWPESAECVVTPLDSGVFPRLVRSEIGMTQRLPAARFGLASPV